MDSYLAAVCVNCENLKVKIQRQISAFKILREVSPLLSPDILIDNLNGVIDGPKTETFEIPFNPQQQIDLPTQIVAASDIPNETDFDADPIYPPDLEDLDTEVEKKPLLETDDDDDYIPNVKTSKKRMVKKKGKSIRKTRVRGKRGDLKEVKVRLERLPADVAKNAGRKTANKLRRASMDEVAKKIKLVQSKDGLEKLYKCTSCGKVFNYRRSCWLHVREKHFGETRVQHPCSFCGQKFVNKFNLKTHEESHTNWADRIKTLK